MTWCLLLKCNYLKKNNFISSTIIEDIIKTMNKAKGTYLKLKLFTLKIKLDWVISLWLLNIFPLLNHESHYNNVLIT